MNFASRLKSEVEKILSPFRSEYEAVKSELESLKARVSELESKIERKVDAL